MQNLTAPPRDSLSAAQVTALLVAPDLSVDFGVEQLDASLNLVSDISADVSSGKVSRDCLANVHGTVDLTISRQLAWGRDRVRPYQLLSSATAGVSSVRFNQGVFVLTSPKRTVGETPITYEVTGFDLLNLLQCPVGDTYVTTAGTTYLQAVSDVLTASGVGSTIMADSTLSATVLPSDMVWALTDSSPASWLRVINDLLASINYRGLWVDQDGRFRSEPYRDPSTRAVEWVFDVADQRTNIIGEKRTESADLWSAPNYWRFVRKAITVEPVEGAGIYTYTNQSTGASSVDSVGRLVKAPTQFLDAADQTSLVAQGDRTTTSDMSSTRLLELTTGPFPIASHFDVATLIDPDLGGAVKLQARSWQMDLSGADVSWVWEAVG
jgi:hypothetical protein